MTDARSDFRQVTDESAVALAELWKEVLEGASREYKHRVRCRKCGITYDEDFTVPDLQARTNAGRMLLEHGWGRPGTVEPERDLSGSLSRPAEELSAEERRAILAAAKAKLAGEDGEVSGG